MSSSKELSTIQNYLRYQEKKLYNLEHHINRMTRQFGKREKLLLSEIAKLHLELRDQTVKFERKLCDHDDIRVGQSSATTTSSSSPVSFNELPPVEEEEVRILFWCRSGIFFHFVYFKMTLFVNF